MRRFGFPLTWLSFRHRVIQIAQSFISSDYVVQKTIIFIFHTDQIPMRNHPCFFVIRRQHFWNQLLRYVMHVQCMFKSVIWQQPLQSVLALRSCSATDLILMHVQIVCVCVFQCQPTALMHFGFHARWPDGVKCCLFSNHAPLGQTTLRVGRVSV